VISPVRIQVISINTVREAVRSRLLYTLLFFALIMIGTGVLLSTLSYVERERIVQDVGLASIRLFSAGIAIFVGVGLIHGEVERRTIFTILSKPLSRSEFLLGKYVGLVLTTWLQVAIMGAAFAVVSLAVGAPLDQAHLAALGLIGMELVVLVAVATLFSAFTTPMLASLFSLGFYAIGHLTRDLRDIGAASPSEAIQQVTAVFHRLMPDLESFNYASEAAHGLALAPSDFWLPVVYGSGYVAILLLLAIGIFERRDFL